MDAQAPQICDALISVERNETGLWIECPNIRRMQNEKIEIPTQRATSRQLLAREMRARRAPRNLWLNVHQPALNSSDTALGDKVGDKVTGPHKYLIQNKDLRWNSGGETGIRRECGRFPI